MTQDDIISSAEDISEFKANIEKINVFDLNEECETAISHMKEIRIIIQIIE